MSEMERITDHAPVVRMPNAAESMGLPPDAVNVTKVMAAGGAKCSICDERVDEHVGPIVFQDENGNPIKGL